ncbi:uncharacterized protein LOC131284486 [Anopheles ziemanni]|uniref:uncharacterized protein LOC131259002 n=1 Tax=Anopheles coustani TaxID=139045 RepID=UPI00265A6E72|nr:uncharacterized protein LOC131259002 [Anopheles coustani]XP_058169329.1 uncharacterized protein LOC131284486 [Anopheles ziemanni]
MSPGADRMAKSDSKLEASLRDLLKAIEKANLKEKEIYALFGPVRWRLWRKVVFRWCTGMLMFMAMCLAVVYVPTVNWHVAAVGRLVMLELLPYWDWTPLYRAKCLIAKSSENAGTDKLEILPAFPDDCAVCQNVETISSRENVSYETLFRHHLIRKVPTVVKNAHPPWNANVRYGSDWKRFAADLEDLLFANPCDFRTNLLFKASTAKTSALARMLDLIGEFKSDAEGPDGWFVQLRNCALKPLKKTRVMFRKPYFYAPHWEPPYTSWVLLSQAYRGSFELTPHVAGLVIVNQLRSQLQLTLRPRTECEGLCRPMWLTLREQQSLVFSTALWNLSYFPSELNQTSVTFVTETYEDV